MLTCLLALLSWSAPAAEPIKGLFLGDQGHHRPSDRFRQLQPAMARHGIQLEYTESLDALDPKVLSRFKVLVVYANHPKITAEQEKNLLGWVEAGGGFVPLHCASYCFLNSPAYINLVGAQFKRHGTGTFKVDPVADHPLLKGLVPFESWDETYVHEKHNSKGRIVLETRAEGDGREPWTWIREQGKGRVFYTAWGHDQRTFGQPGFLTLVERGIRWAAGASFEQAAAAVPAPESPPTMVGPSKDVKPFEFQPARVPFYPATRNSGSTTEPIGRMQKPLEPAESGKHLIHPSDLEPRLFATEDQIPGKPIAMNWDHKGRLWVCCTVDYPNELQPPGKGRDKIVVIEDTNGDGKADKTTVFAENLSIPTSIAFSNGGVIVHQAPQTLFLRDTNGDGRADERTVLLDGWSTGDTHAGPSNLNYGPDNWFYGMVGYAGFDGTVGGQKRSFRTGFYRFKPDGSDIEFLRNTSNNSWGVGFSEEGLLFGSTANGCPTVFLPIPNRNYEAVRGWTSTVLENIAPDAKYQPATDKIRQVDWHGQFTSAAGHALYTARRLPQRYWNRTAFVSDPTGHLTATYELEPTGAGFKARYGWNILASDDEWTAPIVAEVGPDGCVWVVDWYNYIVQHNPTPAGFTTGKGNAYETPLRDKKHGRIYRMVPKGSPEPAQVVLDPSDPETLLKGLANDNMFWRRHAQRLLVERKKLDVVPALFSLLESARTDSIGLAPGAMHALWTLQGLGAVSSNATDSAAVVKALGHPSAGVRRAAIQVLPRTEKGRAAILDARICEDSDAQVRLAALLALSEMPAGGAAGVAVVKAMGNADNTEDRWLSDALVCALAKHDSEGFGALLGSKTVSPAALKIVATVAEHQARSDDREVIMKLLPAMAKSDPALVATIVAGWDKGWPKTAKLQLNNDSDKALLALFDRLDAGGQAGLMRLAARWGSGSLAGKLGQLAASLMGTIGDDKKDDAVRVAAAGQIGMLVLDDAKRRGELLDFVTPRTPPVVATALLEAIGAGSPKSTAEMFVPKLGTWSPGVRSAALRLLVARPDSALVLLQAIDKGTASWSDLALDQKQALASHPNRQISRLAQTLLARGGGLPNPDRVKVVEAFGKVCKQSGDSASGVALYNKHCAVCHRHGGEGGLVGPDLTGMAAHPKEELLIHILDPNRSVEGNFRLHTVTTRDGKVLAGLLASETRTSIELVDSQGKRFLLSRDDVEELQVSAKSIMPEGFEKQMNEKEIGDLLEFLTKRGQFVPLPLDKSATIATDRGMFFADDGDLERLIFPDWSPKTFKGVPFVLINPKGGQVPNAVMLNGPNGNKAPKMPKEVQVPCNMPVRAIHMLSGISGWGYPALSKGTVSLIVRLKYEDGTIENHELRNGEHFADYIRRIDVPKSEFAFALRGQQVRYLTVVPSKSLKVVGISLVKGPDGSSPVVMAMTAEAR